MEIQTYEKSTSNLVKLTGLWKRTSKEGKVYFAGKLKDGSRLVIFKCKEKKGPNSPDLDLLVEPPSGVTVAAGEAEIVYKTKPQVALPQDNDDEDDLFAGINPEDIPV